MRHLLSVIAILSLCVSLEAAPEITSITPAAGPVTGGTIVTIKASGLSACPVCSPPFPPEVRFGGVPALSTVIRDEATLVAISPSHAAGSVDITILQWDGTATAPGAFEYLPLAVVSDRMLLPILTPPVHGAYGSEFRTYFNMLNLSDSDLQLYGLERRCVSPDILCPGSDPFNQAVVLRSGELLDTGRVSLNGTPGRLVYVPKGRGNDVLTNLRVYDVSRNLQSFGTEMPVAHEGDFREDRIVLIGIPESPNFRNTLRIYSDRPDAGVVRLTFSDRDPVDLNLTAGANIFEPAYAVFNDFPVRAVVSGDPNDVIGTVEIHLSHSLADPPPLHPARIWAFITVTNNETQEITTIAPH